MTFFGYYTKGVLVRLDKADVLRVARLRWKPFRTTYGPTILSRPTKQSTAMHRFLIGSPPCDVDHINLDPNDNRRANLRFATRSQNMANTRMRRGRQNSNVRYKGVTQDKRSKRPAFVARLKVNYETKHLGTFRTQEEAARAYNKAALQYFGAFARLNKIPDGA